MNWMDLLRMSAGNLRRRKLRTFLTVLGVVIGTASIVVMISLGLGMKQSLYREVEQSGGLTTMSVTGTSVGDAMVSFGDDGDAVEENKYIDDKLIEKMQEIEHVKLVAPVYEMSAMFLKGRYEGNGSIYATTPEGLKAKNIKLSEGHLPKSGGSTLELVYGNLIPTWFYEKGTGNGYWETGELPNIDFANDSMFMILDQDAYYSSQSEGAPGEQTSARQAKKHVVSACGMVEGGPEDYNSNSYYIFCDLSTLKQVLKKEFAGRVIPGQPSTKSGKPYKEFYYSSAQVKVDDMDYVNDVADQIRKLGYNVETNAEYMESMEKEFAIVEAVLGGIGAVSLFVAAIGIANTMMMSIYERTKEIGIIKVLGCSLKNIRQMFLLEAAAIGLIGGAIGNVLSFLMSQLINILTGHGQAMGFDGNISYIPVWLVLLSMGFAMLVGVAAGYFPALRAMRLSPLAAIRSE